MINMHFNFRNIEATEALKDHVTKKVEKLQKYITYPMEVHVRFNVEKTYHYVEVDCHAEHSDMVAMAKTKDLYESIDMAMHKLEAQFKKEREKRKGHKSAHLVSRPAALKLATDVNADLPHREKKTKTRS